MAYTDDAVKSKMSSLNETQDAIVAVSQWIMFHRRHADRTAQLWMQRLKDSPASRRLNLIYLANEVVQQSKARRKNEFVLAFGPIIAEATAVAYKGATQDIQQKLRRVIEVWRARQIFDQGVQEDLERRVDDLDKSRGTGKKPALGGSLFSNSSGSAPAELQPLVPLQIALSKASVTSKPLITNSNAEYEKLADPSTPQPTPPVHAARLSSLLKSLANAEGAVAESIKARQALIAGLETLLENNRAQLLQDNAQKDDLSVRKASIEAKKREVEDGIMRGLSAEPTPLTSHTSATPEEPERPNVETLTPPPFESLTPIGSPSAQALSFTDTPSAYTTSKEPPAAVQAPLQIPGADLLSSLAVVRGRSEELGNGVPVASAKRRKISAAGDEFAEFEGDAMDGLDADVAEMLGRE
ncbi:DUF618-domain-containing protein [Patellaria atrata CBS 101060]|uniref:DUF618-domain-containing protein n=1 Tax=Patellaria atrata CBS 101060 TaxID=1346257 RepID=A0A9P4VKY1_9PEZI|nr:DUF618-domain-containing protein [Patellaria atrata CBS 101060]